jgi:uncharacterized membrane protein
MGVESAHGGASNHVAFVTPVSGKTLKFAFGMLLSASGLFSPGQAIKRRCPGTDWPIPGLTLGLRVFPIATVSLARAHAQTALLPNMDQGRLACRG